MMDSLLYSRRSFLQASTLWACAACGTLSAAKAGAAGGLVIPEKRFVAGLRAHLDTLTAEDAFSGAVLIARGTDILFQQAFGYAERAYNVRNRVDTKFCIGSMGKMFTAVSVLQLAEAGKLSLNDRLIERVPDYPDKEIAREITIYELLTHTSGLGDMFTRKFWDTPKDRLTTLRSYLPMFTGKPLLFKPGTGWSYSNAGFVVLGLVIEEVSGTDYFDYVRNHVFKRAGMTGTDNYNLYEDVPDMAVGYTMPNLDLDRLRQFPGARSVPPRIKNVAFIQPGVSAGGAYSTVGDLLRFSQALQGHELLSRRYTDLDMTGKVATGRGTTKYAFGMTEDFMNGVRIVGHGGGGPGISSDLDMYPGLGYTAVVLTNFDDAAGLAVPRIRMALCGETIPEAVPLPSGSWAALAGKYRPELPQAASPAGQRSELPAIEVTADATGLWMLAEMRYRFLPLAPTEFFNDSAPYARMTFAKDARGAIVGFTLRDSRENQKLLSAVRSA